MRKFFQKLRGQLILLPLVSWGIVVVLCVGGLSLSGFGMWLLAMGVRASSDDQVGRDLVQICEPPERKKIAVDVSGAVISPGVYGVLQGDRIVDAISAAGGLSELADGVLVSRQLNMATVLIDGQKVHIPLLGEQVVLEKLQITAGDGLDTSDEKISINTASQKELEELTGIGEKRAEDIIAGRPYIALGDLVEKGIVTAAMFEKLQAEIQL